MPVKPERVVKADATTSERTASTAAVMLVLLMLMYRSFFGYGRGCVA